ncbi:hypothetical protein CA235_09725 [Sphingomonas sp. ABOLF]|uniref:DUF7940 domain-containing protein n=1 Tax=Sphingomonas sp. ABOLF TaxID=1985879 RepID=UPI000F7D9D53|nr:hypothetical protein [Sphingomonas sp. ABOLF]RSV15204.1 hypothetical protein CA235_09725 [Sphingomonas sp. ABOLF]
MKIIDWRQVWRWWSVRVSALGALLFALLTAFPDQALALWMNLPAEIRGRIPDNVEHAITAALFAAVMIVRLIPQGEADGE